MPKSPLRRSSRPGRCLGTCRNPPCRRTLPDPARGFINRFENAAGLKGDGVETEFSWIPTERLRFSAALDDLDAKFTHFETVDQFNPLLAINPTWQGKTFNAESGTGFNRLIPLARYAMRVIAPLYRGLRRAGPEIVGFDFRYSADVGLVTPKIPVIALDYGIEEYCNPSVRTFPIKRTRDEIVELLPGLYLGRALLTMHTGEIRTIAHFALRHFENEEVRS